MADLEKTVSIIFRGKDDLSKTIRSLSGKMDDFGQGITGAAEPLANIAKGVLAVDAALAGLAGAGLVYATAKAFEFESATVNLSKILGAQKDQIGVATDAALDLSNQYGRSAVSVLESATDFKRAGFEIKDSLTLTEDAIGLVIGAAEAELGVAEATEIIISTLKGFKAPASEAARLTDILNTVSNEYATNVTELGIGMSKLSPIAHKMGFSFEETAGVLTPVIEIFRSGDEASVALRTGLLKLVDDAKPVKDGLAALGISQRDANGHLRSGKDILFDVAKAFETAEKDEKLFLASQLVGIRQAAKMVEVFDGLKLSTEITGRALDSAGSITREVAAKLSTGEIAVDRFKVGFQNLAIVVGDQFKNASKSAVDGATDIETALQALTKDGAFKPIFEALSKASNDLGKYLTDIATALPAALKDVKYDDLIESLGKLTGEMKEFLGGLDLTDPKDLAKAIQFVVDSLQSLSDMTTGMAEVFGPIIKGIIDLTGEFNSFDSGSREVVGNILAISVAVVGIGAPIGAAKIAFGLLTKAVVSAGGAASTMAGGLSTAGGKILNFSSGVSTLSAKLGAAGLAYTVGYTAGTLINDYVPGVSEAAEATWELIDSVVNFTGTQGEANDQLKETEARFQRAKEQATSFLETLNGTPEQLNVTVSVSAEGDDADIVKSFLDGGSEYLLDEEVKKLIVVEQTVDQIVKSKVDQDSLEKTKKALETVTPDKMLEFETKLNIANIDADIEKFKTKGDVLKSAFEWEGKLDIAEIEANAKKVEALAGSISESFKSTGDTIASLFGSLESGNLGFSEKWAIEDAIKSEIAMRERQLLLQEKLTAAEINLMNEKARKLKSGDAQIQIAMDGIYPELELIMWEIVKRVQVRASEEYSEFLLGIT
jgi:TP901 family phage tail tape measure protein